jgi:hypothetical protein
LIEDIGDLLFLTVIGAVLLCLAHAILATWLDS